MVQVSFGEMAELCKVTADLHEHICWLEHGAALIS